MNFTISKTELYSKLKSISKVIQPKSATQVYSSFLFTFNESGNLSITAGEESGRITVAVEAHLTSDFIGSFLIDSKSLLDGLSNLAEQPLIFSLDGKIITCSYQNGNGEFELPYSSGDIYPDYNITTEEAPISVPANDFLYALSRVSICTANDELRPVLNGVYFDQDGESINYAASDGTILGLIETTVPGISGRMSFILPARFAKILQSSISKDIESINISLSSVNIIIDFGEYNIVCRMIEGRYPNYKSVIPTSHSITARLSRIDLLSALKRVCVFSNKNTSLVVLDKKSDDLLTLRGNDHNLLMKAEETAPLLKWDGNNITIGINSSKMIMLLSEVPSDEIIMEFTDPSRAIIIHRGDDKSDLTYLVMPLTIN